MLRARLALTVFVCAGVFADCSEREHPPAVQASHAGSAGLFDSGLDLDVGAGGGAPCGIDSGLVVCGDQVIPALEDPPNLYFVIDSSGSMSEPLAGSALSKHANARIAVSLLLDAVGHRVRFGAATFPAFDNNPDGCSAGLPIFETQRGDPPCRSEDGGRGEAVSNLLRQLEFVRLGGGTPVAASLDALAPTLLALPGTSYVVLITDGAPNCNYAVPCGSDACIPNIEGLTVGGRACSAGFNCCDPANVGNGAEGSCVDADGSERAVADLRAAGISTFVIGMPGSEPYAEVLNRMATAGGTARSDSLAYYSTSDTASLADALIAIGTGVAIRCDLELAELPPDRELVNVYFDGELLAYGEDEGWAWTGEQSLEIRGQACTLLRSGSIFEVQILAGCETVVR